MKIGIIGAGKLGFPIAHALLLSKVTTTADLIVFQRTVERARTVADELRCKVIVGDLSVLKDAEAVFVCVRPQQFGSIQVQLKENLSAETILISVMAGITLQTLQESAPSGSTIVRSMPNLPTGIRLGITPYAWNKAPTQNERRIVETLFGSFGASLELKDETFLDASTATSGSGPGYVFSFLNAFVDAAKSLGFSQGDSEKLVYQTVLGSVELWHSTDLSTRELRESMRLPGGTTEAAFKVLEQNGFEELIKKAIAAACDRSKELGRKI